MDNKKVLYLATKLNAAPGLQDLRTGNPAAAKQLRLMLNYLVDLSAADLDYDVRDRFGRPR